MKRPPFEVADIIHAVGSSFINQHRSRLNGLHLKVLSAIERCRTAALGGHRDRCTRCGFTAAISYNSCRNRHCPKCRTGARDKWLAARESELLPVAYVHVVFTIPRKLAEVAFHNKRLLYGLLFRSSAATLLEFAADPKHLGAEIGFLSVLHTWGQNLLHHPHVHCVIPAGGLSPDHTAWISPRYRFFLPVEALSIVFRGKFVDALEHAYRNGKLCLPGALKRLRQQKAFRSFVRSLHQKDWGVYAKPPFGGPRYVLHYLARYTHRVAISNHRLVSFIDGKVTFRWKDYAHGAKQRLMTLTAEEFLRRFLQHVLPRGFVRIRFFGFLSPRKRRELLPLCQQLLKPIQRRQPNPRCPARLAFQPLGPVPAVALRWSWSSDSTPGNSRKPSEVTLTRLDSTPPSNRPACHPTRTPGVRPPLGSERRTRRNLRQTALWRASATAGKAALQLVRRSCQLQTPAMRPRNTIQIP